jgi:hypothetical protein
MVMNCESATLGASVGILTPDGRDCPEGTDIPEEDGSPKGDDTTGGNEERPLGISTSIVVVACGSAVFRTVLVLTVCPAHCDVKVTYLRTIVFVTVENAMTTVLSKVGAFPIVMATSNGSGVNVVFAVI